MTKLQCPVCSAQFAKPDHLTRHQLSHGDDRANACDFCPLSFNRRDALLRHWRTCQNRIKSGQRPPALPTKKRGRKLNACIRCSRLKKKCSGTTPCTACANQSQQCIYSISPTAIDRDAQSSMALAQNIRKSPGCMPHPFTATTEYLPANFTDGRSENLWTSNNDLGVWVDIPNFAQNSAQSGFNSLCFPSQDHTQDILPLGSINYTQSYNGQWDVLSYLPIYQSLPEDPTFLRLDIRFLANITSTHGITNSFEIGSSLTRKRAVSNFIQACHSPSIRGSVGIGHKPSVDTLIPLMLRTDKEVEDPLALKSREIVQGIQEALYNRATPLMSKAQSSQLTEHACSLFFSPQNLERFVTTFWHYWYPNWPVFHAPTLEIKQKSARLIAGLSLIGACISPNKIDRDWAIIWLEAVEDWVFSDPNYSEDSISQTDGESLLQQVETRLDSIRAAYALMIIMTWEGHEKHMTRARRTRLTETVCVSRSLYFFCSLQDIDYKQPPRSCQDRWKLYALREECIRTLVYVFMLDCAFVIFNNTAPRTVIGELHFDMIGPEDWFHASTSDEWIECLQRLPRIDQGISFCDAVKKIFQGDINDIDSKIFEQTNLLNHFAITSAFHNLIYLHHYGFNSGSQSPHLSRGLKNWIRVWNSRVPATINHEPLEQDLPGRIGFYRHAREYWCLAVILYSQCGKGQSNQFSPDTGFSRDQGRPNRAIDNSDMGQLHELIVQFREMDLRQLLD